MYTFANTPQATRALDAPYNVTKRLCRRELLGGHGGRGGARADTQLIYSRFRPLRTFRDDGALTLCAAFVQVRRPEGRGAGQAARRQGGKVARRWPWRLPGSSCSCTACTHTLGSVNAFRTAQHIPPLTAGTPPLLLYPLSFLRAAPLRSAPLGRAGGVCWWARPAATCGCTTRWRAPRRWTCCPRRTTAQWSA